MSPLDAHRALSRRRFLRQSFAFSAVAAFGSASGIADSRSFDPKASHLLMLGDWGSAEGMNYPPQVAVAAGMRQFATEHALKIQALLMLGDNWYGDLNDGVNSPRWQKQFEEMYPPEAFDCPAYAVLGNHDYGHPETKPESEIEYARVGNTSHGPTRWTMPARWYRFEFPKHKPLITFLALDSNMPYHNERNGRWYNLSLQQQADQLVFLEAELKRPRKTPFMAVMAHHPVYSDGPHGDDEPGALIRDWDPLFRKYNVHLYLAGHDHDLQHLEFEGHPTSFFLSGGGGANELYDLKIQPSQRGPYAQKVFGFSHLAVTRKKLTLRHLDSNGQVLHAFTKTPEGKIAIVT
jgi:hypothetical protein